LQPVKTVLEMKILVCISNVPDTTSKINFTPDNKEFVSAGLQYIINPYDEIALTRALELTESSGGSVTVINVGDASTEPTIRKALAIGANDAVRVNAAPRDAWFVASQISTIAKSGNYDLVLTGRESIDYNGSQVAAMLGELLGMPSVSICKIPNMRGIMSARTKPLQVVEPSDVPAFTSVLGYDKPAPRSQVRLVESDQTDQLVDMLHAVAKVI